MISKRVALRGCRWPHSRELTFWRRCRCRLSPIPPSMVMRCRMEMFRVARRRIPGDRPRSGRRQRAGAIKPGHAMRMFTGAPMPEGADTVFMQEDVRLEDRQDWSPRGLKPAPMCAPRAKIFLSVHGRCAAGQRLRPQDVALAAAFGLTQVDVCRENPPSRCFRPAMNWYRRASAAPRRNCSIPIASC